MMDLRYNQISDLIKTFGCPLYVFDEDGFVKNYDHLAHAFQRVYPKYRISYSYKTNYTPYICSTVKRLGGYAEVVSGLEWDIAKRVGYEAPRIIFNGPNKGDSGIEAVKQGCIVNVDNLVELKNLIFGIKNFSQQCEIGLRVNIDVGQPFVSRFGMDEEDISKAFDLVKGVSNLRIVGLHCHISRCRHVEAWEQRTRIMLKVADEYFKDRPPQYIDLGSGMFGKMDRELEAQFEAVPSYEAYAEVTAGMIASHYAHCDEGIKPLLFTEPGTTLVSKYVEFIGRVDGMKRIREKDFIILNCSEHNIGETSTLKRLPIRVINASEQTKAVVNADMVGYTCLEQDVMYEGFTGNIGVGDIIVFGNVGGYSNVYKPPFIKPNCAMVAITTDGQYKLIKASETYEDLMHTYTF